MSNFAALCAAVFPLSTKKLRGADIRPPSVRGLNNNKDYDINFNHTSYCFHPAISR